MPFALFHDYFPEIAKRETRTITVFEDSSFDLPPGHYSLLEMFCDEPGCDCRRVMFYVVSSRKKDVEAVVAYGWEDREFYAKWLGEEDPLMIDELQGPILNLGSPQSKLAPAIFDMIEKLVLPDQAYVERVKRHYAVFRERIEKMNGTPRGGKKRKKRKA